MLRIISACQASKKALISLGLDCLVIRVHIAHDNHLLRDSVGLALSREPRIEVVESSPEGAAGLEAVSDERADVLVLWVPWRTQPFDEITRYRRAAPSMKIVGLFTHTSVRNEMIAAGADAVVDEADGLIPLIEAIRSVAPDLDSDE
jgi:DNA-binding NarL/FixJ family response regulator